MIGSFVVILGDRMIKGVQITRLSRCWTMNRDWSFLFCNPSLSHRSSLTKGQVRITIVHPDLGFFENLDSYLVVIILYIRSVCTLTILKFR